MASAESDVTVAVTGPTGTFGFGLVPLLQADDRIRRIVGIARRPFDPAELGWSKMAYRQGDVRDPAALEAAFRGADVVIHLAFLVMGNASPETIRQINIEGTRNAFRAAAAAGARRFVYASSVAAYGFHPDNPIGMTEDWPVRPAAKLFYAQEKAELEHLLADEAAAQPDIALYLLRPPIVVGPHALGAKNLLPQPLAALGRRLVGLVGRVPLPVLVPDFPLQLIHEQDVGQAFLLCAVGAGPPGSYNIAGSGVLSTVDVARELGLIPVPVPGGLLRSAARTVSALPSLPFTPPVAQWIEIASQPAIMDVRKAERELGWKPRYTALEALRDTIRPGD
ncbi:MAG TPA: NAD-dependent epimerase/dehydratase family protein [Pseudonocardiaceae bacterium]